MTIAKNRGTFISVDVTVKNTGNVDTDYTTHLRHVPSGATNPVYDLTQTTGKLTPGQTKLLIFANLITDKYPDGAHDTLIDLYDVATSKLLDSEIIRDSFVVMKKVEQTAGEISEVRTY